MLDTTQVSTEIAGLEEIGIDECDLGGSSSSKQLCCPTAQTSGADDNEAPPGNKWAFSDRRHNDWSDAHGDPAPLGTWIAETRSSTDERSVAPVDNQETISASLQHVLQIRLVVGRQAGQRQGAPKPATPRGSFDQRKPRLKCPRTIAVRNLSQSEGDAPECVGSTDSA
jgi:hypothetical protein